jgi:hypothetical protein
MCMCLQKNTDLASFPWCHYICFFVVFPWNDSAANGYRSAKTTMCIPEQHSRNELLPRGEGRWI